MNALARCETLAQSERFSPAECATFERNGFVIVRNLAPARLLEAIADVARQQLANRIGPLEYEADLRYPGSPDSRDAPGGSTVRRLLQAYVRDAAFRSWAIHNKVLTRVRQLLGDDIAMTQTHHNCVMTKHPRYGSATLWHQDTRYWSYAQPDLVNVWLALGSERRDNGGLSLLPATQRMRFEPHQLDAARFLRPDLAANQALIDSQVAAELDPGDVLFFHAGVFHSAGQNFSSQIKFSLVYSYRAADNLPLPGTRSSALPDITLP